MSNDSKMNRVALVTGAGSGIGRAASLALQQAGYLVVLTGRRSGELERTSEMSGERGLPMRAIPADITVSADVRRLFDNIRDEFGRLDVLFNNAGANAPAVPLDEMTDEQWNAVVAVNLTGTFLCAREAIRLMKTQDPKGGRIINNGSLSAHTPRPFSAPYTATKHAITGLTKSIALDYRKWNIACSQIDIGNAATEMTERMAAGVLQANGAVAIEPRMDVEQVGAAVVYIANLPLNVNIPFMTIMATTMPFFGRG
jgi:NAD(P)-dependent dehydrogenase (short-subunit alcohol dehydrogenase family)